MLTTMMPDLELDAQLEGLNDAAFTVVIDGLETLTADELETSGPEFVAETVAAYEAAVGDAFASDE